MDTMARRFHVHDDLGLLRSFASKQEAMRYMRGTDYTLVIDKPIRKPKVDLSAVDPALF